ncbi:MAG: AI-2E family transporter, partial [Sandaracinaceae bacterium]|nr:AI-2E family transporter [Sandaracinaceae bacterium]
MRGQPISTPSSFQRWLAVLAVGLVVVWLLHVLREALAPLLTALAIAYLFAPLVDRLEAKGLGRATAVSLVLGSSILGVFLFAVLILPGVIREVANFLSHMPKALESLHARLVPWLESHSINLPHSVDELFASSSLDPAALAASAARPLQFLFGILIGGTRSALGFLANLLLIPILAAYFLYDFRAIVEGVEALIPPKHRSQVVEIAREIDEVLGHFIRGQLLVMASMSLLYAIAYGLIGLRLAVPIALLAGLLTFIPYVGSGTALLLGLLMALIDWQGWIRLLWV